jgi:cbb3-type cytochrome oxidase maturation protein
VNIILVMIALSFVMLGGATILFFWAVDNDQFDDLQTPALLPLDDSGGNESCPIGAHGSDPEAGGSP